MFEILQITLGIVLMLIAMPLYKLEYRNELLSFGMGVSHIAYGKLLSHVSFTAGAIMVLKVLGFISITL